jgi:hypothetical protein
MDVKSDANPASGPTRWSSTPAAAPRLPVVTDVDSFNDVMIVLNTSSGAMTLVGRRAAHLQLNLEEGQLLVEGQIDAWSTSERAARGKGGLGRLFK